MSDIISVTGLLIGNDNDAVHAIRGELELDRSA
jgi:hypothetical protein